METEYRRQRRAGRKAHVRVFLEELALVGFLGGVLVFGGYLLMGSFGNSPTENADADDARDGIAAIGPDQTRTVAQSQERSTADESEAAAPEPLDPGTQPERDPGETAAETDTTPFTGEPDSGGAHTAQAESEPKPEPESRPEPQPEPEPEPEPERKPEPEPEPESASTTASTSVPAPTVERATFTYDVVYDQPSRPVTYIEYANTQAGRLYFFTEVDAPQRTELTHEWRYEDEVVAVYNFEVAGNDAVSVSHRQLPQSAHGTWRVYVRDASGEILKIGTALYD